MDTTVKYCEGLPHHHDLQKPIRNPLSQSDNDMTSLCRSYSLKIPDNRSSNVLSRSVSQHNLMKRSHAEKLKLAKEMVENAIMYKKIFTVIGPYKRIREVLRARGYVERFFNPNDYPTKASSKSQTINNLLSSDADDNCDGDYNIDKEEADDRNKATSINDNDSICAIMSRMVRDQYPNFIWSLKKNQVNFRLLRKDQIVNHHERAELFTTKFGLCRILRQCHWVSNQYSDSFFPRSYILSCEEERQAFIDDFRFTACVSVLKKVVDSFNGSKPTEQKKTTLIEEDKENVFPITQNTSETVLPKVNFSSDSNKSTVVPRTIIMIALQQCLRYIRHRQHEDLDNFKNPYELPDDSWCDFLQNYYKLDNDGMVFENVEQFREKCEKRLAIIQQYYPQFSLDGTRNIWMVKPGAKSRGRGISCQKYLHSILKFINNGNIPGNENKYVVQKYIETPLLIYNTKFDIRQWFLISDWNPLTIWWYDECYLRFCSEQFSLCDLRESIHLSNNSIQHKYENGPRSNELPEENMWDCYEFDRWLKKEGYGNVLKESILPGMENAIICSMLCAQEDIEVRKNCFELYGADFMVTGDMSPWLIEVNSSPCMSPSTAVTSRMTNMVLEETLKVILDKKKDRSAVVGKFRQIYRDTVTFNPNYYGLNLSLSGHANKKPSRDNVIPNTASVPKRPFQDGKCGMNNGSAGNNVTTVMYSHNPPPTRIQAISSGSNTNRQQPKNSPMQRLVQRSLKQSNKIPGDKNPEVKKEKLSVIYKPKLYNTNNNVNLGENLTKSSATLPMFKLHQQVAAPIGAKEIKSQNFLHTSTFNQTKDTCTNNEAKEMMTRSYDDAVQKIKQRKTENRRYLQCSTVMVMSQPFKYKPEEKKKAKKFAKRYKHKVESDKNFISFLPNIIQSSSNAHRISQ